jgi:hypothetical protein
MPDFNGMAASLKTLWAEKLSALAKIFVLAGDGFFITMGAFPHAPSFFLRRRVFLPISLRGTRQRVFLPRVKDADAIEAERRNIVFIITRISCFDPRARVWNFTPSSFFEQEICKGHSCEVARNPDGSAEVSTGPPFLASRVSNRRKILR